MNAIGYGVVGTGYFGTELARALNRLPHADVVAVVDPDNGAKAAAELGAVEAADLDELCTRDDVDAVVVATPNGLHQEPVIRAAEAGKHVFCEKPIALSYADCQGMLTASRRGGVLFMAGHVMHFMAGVRRAKQLIAEGVIGDVLFCRAVRNGWEGPQPQIAWKKQRDLSGGHLYHHIHELDLVQSILGQAQTATMAGGNVAHNGPEYGDEDDLLLITLEFAGSRYAALEYGSAFRWPEHHVLIQGSLGAIRIDLQDVGVELRTPDRHERFLLHRSAEEDADRTRIYHDSTTDGAVMYGAPDRRPPLWLQGIVEEEMTYFHDLVRGATPDAEFEALTDGSAATAAIATADALTLSLREGRKVEVSEVTAATS